MKMKFIALAIIASASSGVAQAHLTAADQDLIKAYQQANPDVPSYIINNMKADYMKDLQAVRDYMTGVIWYGNSTLHTLPPLDSVHSNPQVVPLSVKRDQAEGDARVADNQARTTGQTQALHAAMLEQKFGQVKGNIQRTAPQVTALQQAEGDARVADNQARTAGQTQALHAAMLEQKFGQVKGNIQRTAPQVTALQQAEGDARVANNQTRTAGQMQALHAAILDQKFGQVKGNIQRTAPQVTALQQAEGDARVVGNQTRTAGQTQALHAAMLEQKFGQVKGNIQRTAPQVIALQQAEGDARVADNQTRTAGQTQALHAAMLEQKFGQVKGNIQRTAPQVTALQQAEGDARVVSNQQRTLAQSQALTDSKANAVDVTKNNTLNTLSASVTRAEAKGEEAQSRADIAYAHAEENENAIQATNHRVAENSANIAAEEEQITTLKSDTDKNFSKMNNRIDENRQRASAAISGVAAMANIPQVIQGQTFSIGAGVGSTDGESAAAVGFSARAGERVIVKASVSDDTQQNFVIGGGVSYGW